MRDRAVRRPEEIEAAWTANRERGSPAVRGEVIEGDVAGYHYYPGRERVQDWLAVERLTIVEETTDQEEGWAYWHILVLTPGR